MHILSFPFHIISLCGLWCPVHWTLRKKAAYNLFTFVSVALTCFFFMSQFSLFFLTEFNFKFMSEIMYTLLTTLTICIKQICFLIRKSNIMNITNMLLKNWCIPRNLKEISILQKNAKLIK
jgi:hypothetical protein